MISRFWKRKRPDRSAGETSPQARDEDGFDALENRRRAAEKADDVPAELAVCRQIVARYPDRPAARFRLLKLLQDHDPDPQALEAAARDALRQFPDRPEPYRALARAVEKGGNDAEAIAVWKEYLAIDPGDRPARGHVARLSARQATQVLKDGDLDAARAGFARIEAKDATGPERLMLGAAIAKAEGSFDAELAFLREAVAAFPGRLNPQLRLLRLMEAEDHPDLPDVVRDFAARHPDRVEPFLARIRLAERDGNDAAVLAEAERTVATFRDVPQAWLALARRLKQDGDWSRCEAVLTEAATAAPDHRIDIELARLLLAAGRETEALGFARSARARAPEAAPATAVLSQVLFRTEGPEAAQACLAAALAEAPQDPVLLSEAATLHIAAGNHAAARDVVARLVRHAPDHKTTVPLRIWALANGGAPDAARRLWTRHGLGDRIRALSGDDALPVHLSGALRPDRRLLRLSLVQRNARLRLPFFLDYYRAQGVELFVVIDNGSTDGTVEYLAAQPDVCLYATDASFAAAASGMRWINGIMDLCPDDHWWIHADSDEFLVLPGEDVPLYDRIGALEAEGAEIVPSFMLDMFPRTAEDGEAYPEGADPVHHAPYFDATYRLGGAVAAPYLSVTGGVRKRLLETGPAGPAPLLVKTAMTRRVRYVNSHGTTPGAPSRLRGVFLHYKFIGPFLQEVRDEIERKEHYQNAALYRTLDDGLSRIGAASDWLGPDSLRYEGAAQLERLGLIA